MRFFIIFHFIFMVTGKLPPERLPSKIFPPGLGLSVGLRVKLGGSLPGGNFLSTIFKMPLALANIYLQIQSNLY